ncbi:MAG TPA: TlpA disulfide reductase family protein [Candidatus Angelobacter sp.]|nr:TlpA disulfide reductase family protein [Candidatus Angelobacter sp.]
MPALEAGASAPEIDLPLLAGGKFSLAEARKAGPVVVAFYKVSCPVCQLAFPYLERIYKAYSKSPNFTFAGVSQDNPQDTKEFNRRFHVSFPTLLDKAGAYTASNAYGLTNVPTVFVISPKGEIELSSVGWSKPDMEILNHKLAEVSGVAPSQIFQPGESVPDHRPG